MHDPIGIVTGGPGDWDSWSQDQCAELGREKELASILRMIKDLDIKTLCLSPRMSILQPPFLMSKTMFALQKFLTSIPFMNSALDPLMLGRLVGATWTELLVRNMTMVS
jgi:hypothetical protein